MNQRVENSANRKQMGDPGTHRNGLFLCHRPALQRIVAKRQYPADLLEAEAKLLRSLDERQPIQRLYSGAGDNR